MNVLLYVDDSKHWHPVATALGALVRTAGGRVTVLTTLWSGSKRQEALATARRILDLPDEKIVERARGGLVENVIPDEVRRGRFDLVVVGRLGSLDWLTNGLVAHLVVRRTPASVLIMRGKADAVKRILVATEGSRHGIANVRLALLLGRAFGARVTVLHVLSQFPLTHRGLAEMKEVTERFLESDFPEADHLREVRALVERESPNGAVKVRVGLVVDEILGEVEDGRHDLLVLGAHESGMREGFLYQDIAGILIRASPVSYVVVRDAPRRDDAGPAR